MRSARAWSIPSTGIRSSLPSYVDAAVAWFSARHGWALQREWVLPSPGVLPSLSTALLALTRPGDGVVIQPPVYYPFAMRVASIGRRVVQNPLVQRGSRWEMDLEGLSAAIDGTTRALILCNPHNPVSRVWERETLARLVDICARRGIVILADEIHCDLVMPGHRHLPVAASCPGAAAVTVTFVAPTKSFNLAGIGGSFTIIPDVALRARFSEQSHALWSGLADPLSLAGVEAAYRRAGPWLDELLRVHRRQPRIPRGIPRRAAAPGAPHPARGDLPRVAGHAGACHERRRDHREAAGAARGCGWMRGASSARGARASSG